MNSYSPITKMVLLSEAHWTAHWIGVRITLLGEPVLVVNAYEPSVKTEWMSMFERLLLHLQEYDGPIFVDGDFNCKLDPRPDRSFV